MAIKPSMVAMFGRIMPAPLLMPDSVTVLPSICTVRDATLGCVSVVMIASAAASQLSALALAMAAGSPASRRSIGNCSRITPVENGSTWPAPIPNCAASASQVARALARPCSPVPAFALPVLTTRARMPLPDLLAAARCSRHTCTGAAQKRLLVKTPATVLPSATRTTSTSLRLALRMPASAQPSSTPATDFRFSAWGSGRLTGM
ncbi:hypothetical protein D9M72_418680 [compost metagenome]